MTAGAGSWGGGVLALAREGCRRLGVVLHPLTAFPRHSPSEAAVHIRAGALATGLLLIGLTILATSLLSVVSYGVTAGALAPLTGAQLLPEAIVLVALSVLAPQAVFRTRNATLTEQVLSDPSTPVRPWRASTLTFDATLVAAMLAGLSYGPALTFTLFGLALLARAVFTAQRTVAVDPNARYHAIVLASSSAIAGVAAYLVVRPLSIAVSQQAAIIPLLLAAVVALYLGLVLNALERWVAGDHSRWASLRDALDTRRIIIALVSAVIAWAVAVSVRLGTLMSPNDPLLTGTLVALGVFVASWLALWVLSIHLWRRDAARTLTRWGRHQAEVINRLIDGTLSPELARRAAQRITARMALSVFGATRVLVVVDDGHGTTERHFVGAARFGSVPPEGPSSLAGVPNVRMSLFADPGHPNASSITVGGWLWPGWFMVRTPSVVSRFRELATDALLQPLLAADGQRRAAAFDVLFDPTHGWPSLEAFSQAVERWQARIDASPHSASLVVGAYAIEDFGALAGGRFEHAAVAQVMRIVSGSPTLAGHETFVAYEDPGCVWVALVGGPMVRSGVGLLQDLAQRINDHGSVPSARLDIEVHVSVAFGHAAHQVDDFSVPGLLEAARQRLDIDRSARDPFGIAEAIPRDIRPEDIIETPSTPATAVDARSLLADDRRAQDAAERFPVTFTAVQDRRDERVIALLLDVGWRRTIGAVDLTQRGEMVRLANRHPELAAEAAGASLDRVKQCLGELAHLGRGDLPLVVAMPTLLLHPDCGELALPNLVSPFLDRAECSRLVVLVDTIPPRGGEALRLLADRGVGVAVTASAAASASMIDLEGWPRWGIVLPAHVMGGHGAIDGLMIQQTTLAIATRGTRVVGAADRWPDVGQWEAHRVGYVLNSSMRADSVEALVAAPDPAR